MGGTGGCKVKLVARPGPLAGNRQADPLQKPRVVPRRLSHRLRETASRSLRYAQRHSKVPPPPHRARNSGGATISAHMSTRPRCGGRGRRSGAMRDHEPVAQADRHIAECNNRIARQREVIANAFQRGHDTNVAVSMLRALEASLRAFEAHRQFILDQQKKAEQR